MMVEKRDSKKASPAATRKNGARRHTSRAFGRRCQATRPRSTSGRITVEPLLSIASTKAARLSQYGFEVERVDSNALSGDGRDSSALGSTRSTSNQKIDSRKN